MSSRSICRLFCLLFCLELNGPLAYAVTIDIDYRLDNNNFFDTGQKRSAMQFAADLVGGMLNDNLAAMGPKSDFAFGPAYGTWDAWTTLPYNGNYTRVNTLLGQPEGFVIPEDHILVFVGGRPMESSTGVSFQGDADPTIRNAGPTWDPEYSAWLSTIIARGQSSVSTDVGPWGGTIAFNSNVAWDLDRSNGIDSDKYDLVSTAIHELFHVLGFGTATSYTNLIDTSSGVTVFRGALAEIEYDLTGYPPLDPGQAHWEENVRDNGCSCVMVPGLAPGQQQVITWLDAMALADIGWEVTLPVRPICALPGDFNNDGSVNAADYVTWRKNGGTQDEFNTWRANFGNTFSGSGSSLNAYERSPAIPEPPSLILLATASLLSMLGTRKSILPRNHKSIALVSASRKVT